MQIQSGLDFLFPRLHGLWASSFFDDGLDTLLRGGLDGFGRALSGRDVQVTNRAEVQKRLTVHFIEMLARERRFLDSGLDCFYDAFIRRYFYEDVKSIVRGRHLHEPESRLRDLLLLSDHFPRLPVTELLAAQNINQFYKLLPEPKLRDSILPVLVELDDGGDIWLAESRIDALMMAEFLGAAKKMNGDLKRIALELIGTEIDIENMILLLRKTRVADFPESRLQTFVLKGGRLLADDSVMRLAGLERWADMVESLPPEYGGILSGQVDFDADAHEIETRLWCLLYRRCARLFRDFDHPRHSALAFPYLKRFEVINLARVFEALYLRLEPQFVNSILVRS